jgi:hypothetical protein
VPDVTGPTLPLTSADLPFNSILYCALAYFNGVLNSGFLPVGPAGETYFIVEIVAGHVVSEPPSGPNDWSLVDAGNGEMRIRAVYTETGSTRAHEWAIAYTTNGTDPPIDAPDVTIPMLAIGAALLDYVIVILTHGATLKVRVQTRRNDGSEALPDWRYSRDSYVLTITVDTSAPATPLDARVWPGPPPGGD